jgi:hypothetical protein
MKNIIGLLLFAVIVLSGCTARTDLAVSAVVITQESETLLTALIEETTQVTETETQPIETTAAQTTTLPEVIIPETEIIITTAVVITPVEVTTQAPVPVAPTPPIANDGLTYTVVLNTNSSVFHTDQNCRHVGAMKDENKSEMTATIDAIKAAGYKACGTCSKAFK